VLILATAQWVSMATTAVEREIDAIEDTDGTVWHDMALKCMADARDKARKVFWYAATAPVVVFYALLFKPKDSQWLPKWASKWDNNAGCWGDGEYVLRDGEWIYLGDPRVAWKPEPGERIYRATDPEFKGKAYYWPSDPRGFWAMYDWCGWRNRASKLAESQGVHVTERPVYVAGNPDASKSNPGWSLMKWGEYYQYRLYKKIGPLMLIRNYGLKLGIASNWPPEKFQDSTALVPYAAIGVSFQAA